jgi:hypothetical protein
MARPGEIEERQINKARIPKKSIYKGVTYQNVGKKRWRARYGKKLLGSFLTEHQAYTAYKQYVKKLAKQAA